MLLIVAMDGTDAVGERPCLNVETTSVQARDA
jgi:hypothetical protein